MSANSSQHISGFDCIYNNSISLKEIERLVQVIISENKEAFRADSNKTGRGEVLIEIISTNNGSRKIVIRKGKRGGALRHIISSTYFAIPTAYPSNTRMREEYEILLMLREKGVRVPEPAFALTKKNALFFYGGYLATFFISDAVNFYNLAKENIEASKLLKYAYDAGFEARKMLLEGVLHRDLHLGNVVISNGSVYLIDFDKALKLKEDNYKKSSSFLLERWNRAIEKRFNEVEKKEALIKGFKGGLLC